MKIGLNVCTKFNSIRVSISLKISKFYWPLLARFHLFFFIAHWLKDEIKEKRLLKYWERLWIFQGLAKVGGKSWNFSRGSHQPVKQMETGGSPGGPHLRVQSYKLISEPLQYFLKLFATRQRLSFTSWVYLKQMKLKLKVSSYIFCTVNRNSQLHGFLKSGISKLLLLHSKTCYMCHLL